MKNAVINLLIFLSLFISFHSYSQNKNEAIVKKYVHYFNSVDIPGFDSILTDNCKSFSEKIISDKKDLIEIVKNLSRNEKIEITNIQSKDNIIKTEEQYTDDIINYLELEPIFRKREYHFNRKNKIKSIYNIEVKFPKDFLEKQEKFFKWANYSYPDLYKDMIKKYEANLNIDAERRYLFILLKNKGLNYLDSVNISHNTKEKPFEKPDSTISNTIEEYPNDKISFEEFRLNVLLKTKDQVEQLFGKACMIQHIAGKVFWYYGSMKCDENYTGPIIFFEDNGKEVNQVQLQFNANGIVVSVNAI